MTRFRLPASPSRTRGPEGRFALVAWLGVGAACALMLAAPLVRVPGDDLGLRRFKTPEVTADIQIAQAFEMTADGLHAVDVFPARVNARVNGNIRLELQDVTETRRVVRSKEVSAAELIAAPRYRFEFAPITDSQGRRYRIEFISSEAQSGIAMWATKGERYGGGAMFVKDRDRWADLAFETHAPVPTRWDLLMARREKAGVSRVDVVLAALVLYWILVGLVLRAVVGISDSSQDVGLQR